MCAMGLTFHSQDVPVCSFVKKCRCNVNGAKVISVSGCVLSTLLHFPPVIYEATVTQANYRQA